MNVIAAAGTQPADALSTEVLKAARVPADATLQERVTIVDIAKATSLLEKIEEILASGHENHVGRDGTAQVVPLRVDSAAKLLHAYVALSNLRAARSGVVTSIREVRRTDERPTFDPAGMSEEEADAVHLLTERMAQRNAMEKSEKS